MSKIKHYVEIELNDDNLLANNNPMLILKQVDERTCEEISFNWIRRLRFFDSNDVKDTSLLIYYREKDCPVRRCNLSPWIYYGKRITEEMMATNHRLQKLNYISASFKAGFCLLDDNSVALLKSNDLTKEEYNISLSQEKCLIKKR